MIIIFFLFILFLKDIIKTIIGGMVLKIYDYSW